MRAPELAEERCDVLVERECECVCEPECAAVSSLKRRPKKLVLRRFYLSDHMLATVGGHTGSGTHFAWHIQADEEESNSLSYNYYANYGGSANSLQDLMFV